MMGHQETSDHRTSRPTWLGVKVMKKQGKSLDTSKACSAKGIRPFCLCHPQEEEEDQEGGVTPQMTMTTMTEGIIVSAEKCAQCKLQIALSNSINRAIWLRIKD